MVTKGGHLRGSKLYKTNKTIEQGVAKLYSYVYTKRTRVLIYLYTKCTDILTYSTIAIGRSYIFKYIVFTIR